MPTLRQFTYLVAVDDERHFGRAAQRVNVSQPTLSAQIQQLEHRLGVQLIERSRSGVSPTPIGQEIIARARKVLSDVQEIVDLTKHQDSPLSGRIRLGVPPTLGPYVLPHIIPELHRQYPDLKLYVREAMSHDIQDQLLQGELDLALTPLPVLHQAMECTELFIEELKIAAAFDHPLANKKSLRGEDLKGQKVLTMAVGNHLHAQVRELCDQFGATLLYDYEGTSLDTLRHMVVMDVGICFFPALYVLSEIGDRPEIRILDFEDVKPLRQIGLVWRKGNSMSQHYHDIAALFSCAGKRILGQDAS